MDKDKITGIITIDENKVVVSDKVSYNNRKDFRYIVGYQVDEGVVRLFIKALKKIFIYGVS